MASEVYTTALLAYFAALPDATNTADLFAKAEATMDGLNGTVGTDEAGQRKLISIYVTLAEDVREMLLRAPAAKRKTLKKVFSTFLDRVAKTSDDVPVLSWAATNFYELGVSDDPGTGEPPADAKEFYAKAADQNQALLAKAGSDEAISPEMQVFLRTQLATVYRRQGKFVLAMDQMEEILKDEKRNMTLDLQVAAAETYMEWAASDIGIDRLYLRAINGGRKSGKKNNIWGWVRIAKILAAQIQKPELDSAVKEDYYQRLHDAKISQARCNYEFGMAAEGDERQKFLNYAKQDIQLAAQSYPDLGGDAKKKQYDQLLKDVQTALKESPEGIAIFEESTVASTDSSGSGEDGGGGE